MKMVHAAAAGFACLVASPQSATAQTPAAGVSEAAPVPVQQVAIGETGKQMMLAIWQPGGSATSGAAGRSLPLVVISHGTGAGPAAHIDTAEALAAAGFVVAAPMHRGDNFQDDSKVGRPEWMASRSRDVSETIDYMLRQWSGRERLDASRVGLFGFSAGATTALVSAGAAPDLGRIGRHCAARREFVCDLMKPGQQAADAAAPGWTRDDRVAAIVLAAPGLGFAFEASALEAVTVPVQLWAGEKDGTVPYATNAGLVRQMLRGPVDFQNVENAVHLSFLAPCTSESPPQLCQDNPGFDRAAFHRTFNKSVVSFFERSLPLGGTDKQVR